jgi:serine/threonine protein kinase
LNSSKKSEKAVLEKFLVLFFVLLFFSSKKVCKNKTTNELVAIKRIEKTRAIKSRFRINSVWVERKFLGMFRSPFVLRMYHAFQDEKYLYMVTPFLAGGDLTHYSRTHEPLDEDGVRFYIAELIVALEYLHEHGSFLFAFFLLF